MGKKSFTMDYLNLNKMCNPPNHCDLPAVDKAFDHLFSINIF